MSYDVSIGSESFNYTSNVAKLFYDHMTDGIRGLDGLTGKEVAARISDCLDAINVTRMKMWDDGAIGEPKFCRTYDAKNGWGSALGAILFLAQIMAACHRHPRSKLRVSA